MAIDKSKIKAGDKVKIRRNGMISENWTTVKYSDTWDTLFVHSYSLNDSDIHVLEHRPNFKALEDELENARLVLKEAQEEVRGAEQRLKEAHRVYDPEASNVGQVGYHATLHHRIGVVKAWNDSPLYPNTYTIEGLHYAPGIVYFP